MAWFAIMSMNVSFDMLADKVPTSPRHLAAEVKSAREQKGAVESKDVSHHALTQAITTIRGMPTMGMAWPVRYSATGASPSSPFPTLALRLGRARVRSGAVWPE